MAGKSRRALKRNESSESADSWCSSTAAETSQPKKSRIDLYVELRILLPNKVAGAIIGRGGENIKRLRRRFLANVNLPSCKGPERILTITAELSVTCEILEEIISTISIEMNVTYSEDNELRILLNSRQAGAVIGRRGDNVKALRERTGSVVKVFDNWCPESTDQVIKVQGTKHAIINCVRSILKAIEHTTPPRKQSYYDPNNHDPVTAAQYGGYNHGGETLTVRNHQERREQSDADIKSDSESINTSLVDDDKRQHPNQKQLVSAAHVPSLFSINLSANAGFTKTNCGSILRDMLHSDENRNYIRHRVNASICGEVNPSLSTSSAAPVPSLLSVMPWPEAKKFSLPWEVTATYDNIGPAEVRNGRSTMSQSGTTIRRCFDQLMSAVSCFIASSLSESATGFEKFPDPVSNKSLTDTNYFDFYDDIVSLKDAGVVNDVRCTKPVMTSQVKIPQKLVGVVLGNGNSLIKSLEATTSTKIWRDAVRDEAGDCKINITGNPDQLERALSLIQSM